jgi:hypothetical protein
MPWEEKMSFEPAELVEHRARVIREVGSVLAELFSETGMRTVLYYLSTDFDTGLEDAWENPLKFRTNVTIFLGDFGGNLIMSRIEHRLVKIGMNPGRRGMPESPRNDDGRETSQPYR